MEPKDLFNHLEDLIDQNGMEVICETLSDICHNKAIDSFMASKYKGYWHKMSIKFGELAK